MTGINDLPSLVIATLIFLAIPGPGTIKLFTSMAEQNGGPKAGFFATLGLMAGDAVWMVLALSGVGKWICVLAMLLGRLEIFTLLLLFTVTFWRK